MLTKVDQDWLIELDNDLEDDVPEEETATRTLFRVPAQIREVSPESYNPKFFSFGLYGDDTGRVPLKNPIRKDIARIFRKITGKQWAEIRSKVVGNSPKEWEILYDELEAESNNPQAVVIRNPDDTQRQLTLDAVFIACFIKANHEHVCKKFCFRNRQIDLNEVIMREACYSRLNLIRLDMIKFENQIPLRLVENAFNMMPEEDQPHLDSEDQPRLDSDGRPVKGHLTFNDRVAQYVDMIYCNLPGYGDRKDFMATRKEIAFNEQKHLLHCLYSVVCYKREKQAQDPKNLRGDAGATGVRTGDGRSATAQPCTAPQPGSSGRSFDGAQKRPNYTGVVINGAVQSAPSESRQVGLTQGSAGQKNLATLSKDKGKVVEIELPVCNVPPRRSTSPSSSSSANIGAFSAPSDGNPGTGRMQDGSAQRLPRTDKMVTGHSNQINGSAAASMQTLQRQPCDNPPQKTPQEQLSASPHQKLPREQPSDSRPALQKARQKQSGDSPPEKSSQEQASDNPPQKSTPLMKRLSASLRQRSSNQGQAIENQPQQPPHRHSLHIPTVTQLEEAGITVAVGPDHATKRITDVNFQSSTFKGTLFLPAFSVFDETEILLRNLLTFEYVVKRDNVFLSYIHLMDNLINTEQDVKLMIERGVLKNNSVGSDEALPKMWNTMLTGVVITLSKDYQEVFDQITKHYDKKSNKLMAEFRKLYLRRPWLFGGSVLLVLTALATIIGSVYQALQYYSGNKN